jgi:ABC-type Zn uptake system ZnuABC Zn-binding protein ZnuA
VGTAIPSASTETGEPSAANIANLIEQIKAQHVPAIFIENITNPALMNQIAHDAGVVVGPPLYTDALGVPGSQGDTYLKMMRYNVSSILAALNQ